MVSRTNALSKRHAVAGLGFAVMCWLGMFSLAWGQFQVENQRGGNAESDNSEEDSASLISGTPLDIDRQLKQKINMAEQYMAEGKTAEALALWQLVMSNTKNALTTHDDWTVQTFAKRKYTIFRPVTSEIEGRLAKLSREDMRLYRQTFDTDAELLLKEPADRLAAMQEVVDHYFMSSLGDEAAYYLAIRRFDEGDYVGSARLMHKILATYPESNISPTQLRLRLALACVRMRDLNSAKKHWAEYQDLAGDDIPDAIRRTFQQELARAEKAPEPPGGRPAAWRMQFGGAARNRDMPALPARAVDEQLSETWVVPFETQLKQTVPNNASNTQTLVLAGGRVVRMAQPAGGRSTGRSTVQRKPLDEEWREHGWMPARQLYFDQGRMFVNGNSRVMCFDAADGRMLWMGRRYQYEADPAIRYFAALGRNVNQGKGRMPITMPEIRLFGDRLHPLMTVEGDTLYTLEGKLLDWGEKPRDDVAQNTNVAMGMRRARKNWMAAYETRTGKLKWYRDAGNLGEGESADDATGFLAAPVPYGDRLLVPVSQKGELWMYSLHKDTGKTDWKVFLWDEPQEGVSPWAAVGTAVEGADLYLATGMGLVFALDAATGKVHWAMRYSRQGFRPDANNRRINPAQVAAAAKNGWMEDVVIPRGNHLVVLPSDYDHILTLDRRTGDLLWDSPQVPFEGDPRADYCLGVSGQGLFVGGKEVIRRYDIPTGRLLWESSIPAASGQAALTPEGIYVPSLDAIVQIDPESGRQVRETKFYTPTGEPVGNLFSDGRRLYGVGLQRVYALASLTDRMQTLAKRIDEGDGHAQLTRMRIHQQRGNRQEAMDDLEAGTLKIRQREGVLHSWVALYGGMEELDLANREPQTALRMLLDAHGPAIAEAKPLDEDVSDSIRSTLETQRSRLIYSALQTIQSDKSSDAMDIVLAASALCTTSQLEYFIVRLVGELARDEHRPALEQALKTGTIPTRLAAAEGLLQIVPDEAGEIAQALLADEQDRVRLQGAKILANQGDRKVLTILSDMLESEDVHIRAQSASVLRALTQQNFQFTAYEKPEVRAEMVAEWKNWIQDEGQTAELHFPLQFDGEFRGRTLYTNYNSNTVYEMDQDGKEVWKHNVAGPWSCQGLPNGNRLVSSYRSRSLHEFDENGKEVWKKDGLPGSPYSARRLSNGNTLVSCSNNKVYEYAPDGKEVYEASLSGSPRSVSRMDNGNTLVAVYTRNEVVELNKRGDVVWRVGNMNNPMTAQRLPNGHTVIAQYNSRRIVEVDPRGKTVWTHQWNNPIYDVQRLENGNTLIADTIGWTEIDPGGKTIKQVRIRNGARSIHRY